MEDIIKELLRRVEALEKELERTKTQDSVSFYSQPTEPANPITYAVWVDTTSNAIKYYNGSSWTSI